MTAGKDRPTNQKTANRGARAGLRHGFTLVELLTIIIIIGMLVALVTPAITESRKQFKITQSKAIMGDVFHRPGYTAAETAKSEDDLKRTAGPTNSAFIMAQDDHYKTDTLNPQFRYEGGTENMGRWRSQTLRFSSYSMVVTDGDGDGKNEIFILQKEGIAAYREKEGKLALLDNFKLASNLMNIRLEAADLDKDGLPEFIIGAYQFEPKSGIKAPEGPPSR